MKHKLGTVKRIVVAVSMGAFALQFAGCTNDQIQSQLANGLRTALNGIINLSTSALANDIFDVDD